MAGGSQLSFSLAGGRRLWPGLIVLLALGLRAWVAIDQEVLISDAPRFLAAAQLFLDGEFRVALAEAYHPLTAVLIALTSLAAGIGLESAGLIVSVLSGGIATAALYLLARNQFGERVALVAALLFAVHPQIVEAATSVQSDGLHLAFFLVGALLAWRALEKGRFFDAFGAGILCALAYLTRPEGLAIGVVLGGWLVVDLVRKRISWRRFGTVAAGFATVLLVFGGPYLLILKAQTGSWVLTQKKRVVPAERRLPQPAWAAEAVADIGHAGLTAFREVYLALALFALRRRRPGRHTLYLLSYTALLLPVLFSLHLQWGYVSSRHWLLAVALLMPFVAVGALRVADWLKNVFRPLRARTWAVPALVGLLVGVSVVHSVRPQTEPVKLARKGAALWLRSQEPDVVAAPRARSAYYAGAKGHVPLASAPDGVALADWLRAQGADFVIAEEERLPPLPPGGVPGLREVYRVEYPGGSVRVLRVEALSGR
jgi:4-amino-4-deoxy-L-arabinose transferase-like glycosyltransferase